MGRHLFVELDKRQRALGRYAAGSGIDGEPEGPDGDGPPRGVANLLIVIAGLGALLGVEVRELPDVDRPVVSVRAFFDGASPETMDAEVTSVIEAAVARVSGASWRCRSRSLALLRPKPARISSSSARNCSSSW